MRAGGGEDDVIGLFIRVAEIGLFLFQVFAEIRDLLLDRHFLVLVHFLAGLALGFAFVRLLYPLCQWRVVEAARA